MKKSILAVLICSGLLVACSSSSKDHSITPSLDSQDAKSSVHSNSDKNNEKNNKI